MKPITDDMYENALLWLMDYHGGEDDPKETLKNIYEWLTDDFFVLEEDVMYCHHCTQRIIPKDLS